MKKKFLCGLLIINFISLAQVPTNSLSAYYPFNGNTQDYIGTRHGVSAGVAQYGVDRFGHINGCYDVVGYSNHIKLPSDYWLYGDYSISAWVKIKQIESYPRLYDFSNGYVVNNAAGKLSNGGNGAPTLEYIASAGSESHYFSPNPLTLNTWYHLVFISSGTQMKIYVNNVLDGMATGTHIPENIYRTKNKIGGSNNGDDTNAFIDDFRLYDRAITPVEVAQLYNEPDNFVGVKEIENELESLSIFPNPATDYLDINFSSISEKSTKLEVFDNIGKLIIKQSFETAIGQNNVKINTEKLANGFYHLSITSGSQTQNLKFVKN